MIFNNIVQISNKNIYNGKYLKTVYFEEMVHYKYDKKIFTDIRNNLRIIQLIKVKSNHYLYLKIPKHLFIDDFEITYWLDKKLAELFQIKPDGYFKYNSQEMIITKNSLFKKNAIKINKTENELLTDLSKLDDTGEEKNVSSEQSINNYEYSTHNYNVRNTLYDKKIDVIENIKLKIRNQDNIYEFLMDFETKSERKGLLFKEWYYQDIKKNIYLAFCCNHLVHY